MLQVIKKFLVLPGIIFVIIGIVIIISPIPGAYHTYYSTIFNTTFEMQPELEQNIEVLLKNQTTYNFYISTSSQADINPQVNLTTSYGEQIQIFVLVELKGYIEAEFISTEAGNYTFHLTELNQQSPYPTSFGVRKEINDYYPDGGRYASINIAMKNNVGFLIIIFGCAITLPLFLKKVKVYFTALI